MTTNEQLDFINDFYKEHGYLKTCITDPKSIQIVYDLMKNEKETPYTEFNDDQLFSCYACYFIIKENYEKGVEYAKMGHNKNCFVAIGVLAECYRNGHGVEQDDFMEFELYKKVSEMKCTNPHAIHLYSNIINKLALCYENGSCTEEDAIKAFELYQIAANLNNFFACYYLAECYYQGYGTKQDYEKAVHLFQICADNGDCDAIYLLGKCYENGTGVKKDQDKALDSYKRAADLYNKDALVVLGNYYYEQKDYETAHKYYDKIFDPEYEIKLKRGHCLYEIGNIPLAIEEYQHVIDAYLDKIAISRLEEFYKQDYTTYAKLCVLNCEKTIEYICAELKRISESYNDAMKNLLMNFA